MLETNNTLLYALKGLHQSGIIKVITLPDVHAPLHEVGGFANVAHWGGDVRGQEDIEQEVDGLFA
jgi:hypothetical protein